VYKKVLSGDIDLKRKMEFCSNGKFEALVLNERNIYA
jgi:hypothetical protein